MPKRQQRKKDRSSREQEIPVRRSLGLVTKRCLALGKQLRRGQALDPILRAVTRAANELTRSHQCTLRLLDDSGKRLLTSARTGPSVHRRGNTPFRIGEGLIGWVAVHSRPAMVNGVKSDPRFVTRRGQLWTPTGIMAVPLSTGRVCIGVLSVARKDGRRYTRTDQDLLQLVAQLSVPYLEIARLKRLNDSDPLTLLHNRRHLQDRLPQEVYRARRSDEHLAVAMLDLDHFKRVNDTHGHDVGDEVLVELAERFRRTCRTSDVIARWGGEEFFVIFPQTTLSQATQVAERLREAAAEETIITTAGDLLVTLSVGVAVLEPDDEPASLEKRADQAMYRAKRAGRDRVSVANPKPKKKNTRSTGCVKTKPNKPKNRRNR